MSTLTQTPSVLKVHSQMGMLSLVFGIPFTLMGWGVMFFVGQVITLTCVQRDPIPCVLTQRNVFRTHTLEIENLQGAEIRENYDSDGSTYQVLLITEQGRLGLTSYASSGYEQKQQQLYQINAFIRSAQPLLQIKQDDRFFGYLIGGLFFVIGLVCLGSLFTSITAIFDKSQGKFYLHEFSLLWNRRHEYPLYQVAQIDLEVKRDSDGDPTYRLAVVLRSGERFPLSLLLAFPGRRQRQENTARQIRQFLGLKDSSYQDERSVMP